MIRRLIILLLYLTLGYTQVSLEIQNVDLDAGTLDIYMTNVAGCSYCTDATYSDKAQCILFGSVNNNGLDATWDFSTDIDEATCESSTTNGDYFNGEIGGFQFELAGITIMASSSPTVLIVSAAVTTNPDNVGAALLLGFSLTGETISAGSNVLTQITFTDFNNSDICFGDDTGTIGYNIISDGLGGYIAADWGDCYSIP